MSSGSATPQRDAARTLDDRELAELDALLDAAGPEQSMVLEELDGFCTALACSPEPIAVAEVLDVVLGDEAPRGDALAIERLLALLARHQRSIVAALHGGEGFSPVLESEVEIDSGLTAPRMLPGNLWAIGFLRGIDAQADAWAALDENESLAGLLAPIEALANERDPHTGRVARALRAPRQRLIDDMVDSAFALYEWFEPERRRRSAPKTVRHDAPRIGRNAPCPCGSGRKYKLCCGAEA